VINAVSIYLLRGDSASVVQSADSTFSFLNANNKRMARVVIEGLTKVFSGARGESIRSVDNLNLTVEDKEFMVLVGPSGSGKTTTLRLIAGLEEPTEGTISIDGRAMNDVTPNERDIAMVFQNYALYPHMTAYENLAFGLKLRKCPGAEIEKRVKEAAEILGLGRCLDRRPSELSGGQRQRVAVGRAIVRKPRLFLFDEPLSNLDPTMRAQMRAEISRLHQRLDVTMIYVTHDQVEAMTMGQRIAVMKDGGLRQLAEPMALYQHPANLFVAGFIGSPPINLIRGSLVRKIDGIAFQEEIREGGNARLILRLNGDATAGLAAYAGKAVILGIRPENIANKPQAPDAPAEWTFETTVEIVEPMGPETYVHLAIGSGSIVARWPIKDPIRLNQKLSVVIDMREAHFFDPLTEKMIL
jgi:multiple sugar transport system ATP-binding protein